MNVAIITDLVLSEWVGGGTLVNDYIARRLAEEGHSVRFIRITPKRNDWSEIAHGGIDIYFVMNIPHMPEYQIRDLIQAGKPYIVFRHDVASICYLPTPTIHPSANLAKDLFQNARANVFISNLQFEYYKRLGEIPNAIVIPPPMDLDAFFDQKRKDRAGHLYLGEISEQRGALDSLLVMKEIHAEDRMKFVGQCTDERLAQAIRTRGGVISNEVNHARVPYLLNQYRHFYYHPRIIDAFCLKVVEAELCGMSVHVTKKNIGRYYFDATAEQLSNYMKNESAARILELVH